MFSILSDFFFFLMNTWNVGRQINWDIFGVSIFINKDNSVF